MEELNNVQETPVAPQEQKPVEDSTSTQQPSADDLFSRVTRFTQEHDTQGKSTAEVDTKVFSDAELIEKINSIEDPELREHFMGLRKNLVGGANNKFQEVASMVKELKTWKESLASTEKEWTPERIQSLLNDPNFVNAAQQVAEGTLNPDDISDEYVPESVKKELRKLQETVSSFQQQQNFAQLMQEHNQLKQKYGNYDPQRIDEIRSGLLNGKVKATSEHLYKAFYHDENVKRAYEMGRQDERSGIGEKASAASFDGGRQLPNQNIKPEKGESDKNYWRRIVAKNVALMKK